MTNSSPTATIALATAPNEKTGTTLQFTVTFSSAVTGVDAGAFSLAGTNTGASITNVAGSGAVYTVTVNPGSGAGTVELDITGSKIRDLFGNWFGGSVFAAQTTGAVGSSPAAIALADINNDGKLDIVVANSGGATISILTGNGDGTFKAQTTAAVGTSPDAVAIGDVNGDGKPDIVVANSGSSTVSILLNIGNGSFATQTTAATGTYPDSVVLTDVNGDGKLDILTANQNANTVSILLGAGTGAFGAQTTVAAGTTPASLGVVDLNGDGKLDLVVSDAGGNNLSVLLGNGNGTFAAATQTALGLQPSGIALRDVDGDGKVDAVSADVNANKVSVLLGNGTGTFAAPTTYATGTGPVSVAVGDVNGDGKIDILAANLNANTVSILLGNGDGTFQAQTTAAVGARPDAIALGDLNGDGRSDIVAANGTSGTVSILLNSAVKQTGPAYTLKASYYNMTISVSGLYNGAATKNATQTVFGYVDSVGVGTTVKVYDGATQIGTTTVGAGGAWSTQITLSGEGQHTLTAKDAAFAGSAGASGSYTVKLDTVAPSVAITSSGAATNLLTQTVSGTVDVADAYTTVYVMEGGVQIGSGYVQANGAWTASVVLSGGGVNVVTATDTDAAGNIGSSNSIAFNVGAISGFTFDTGVNTSIAVPGATSTQVYGANSSGVCFGTYVDAVGSHAFAYNAAVNSYTQIPLADAASSISFAGISFAGVAYGTYVDQNGTTCLFVYDPTTQAFSSGTPFPPPMIGAPPSAQSLSLVGISAGGLLCGSYTDMSGGQTPFAYDTASKTISIFYIQNSSPGAFLQSLALSANGILYGSYSGGISSAFLYDTVANTELHPQFMNGNGSFTISGVSDSGVFFGVYQDYSNYGRAFIYDSVSQTLTDIADPYASASYGTNVSGVTSTGFVYGSYSDPGNFQHPFLYDIATQTYVDINLPSTAVITGASSAGLLFGRYYDASNNATSFILDPTTNVATVVAGPAGSPANYLNGIASGLAYGSFVEAGGSTKAFLYDLAHGTYEIVSDPATAVGYTTFIGVTAGGLFYGQYVDDLGVARAFVYDPATKLYGSPGALFGATSSSTLAASANGQVFGNYAGGGGQSGFVYTPGGSTLHAGQSAYFTLAVNKETLTVSANAALTLSNGATALYNAQASSNTALVFVYTAKAGPGVDTSDLRVTGFTGSIVDAFGAPVDPTAFVITDTHLAVQTVVISTVVLAITSPGGSTNQVNQTITGTIDLANAGRIVSIYDGSALLGSAKSAADGSWSVNVTLVGDGVHSLVASAPDAGGNVGTSAPALMTLDTHGPSLSILSPTDIVTQIAQTVSGTIGLADAGRTVSIYDGASLIGTAVSQANGTWSANVLLTGSGENDLVAKATDTFGNTGSSLVDVLDAQIPTPVISVFVASSSILEGQAAVFNFSRQGDSSLSLDVPVSIMATNFADPNPYPPPISVHFDAGSSVATLSLGTVDDHIVRTLPSQISLSIASQPGVYDVAAGGPTIVTVHDIDGGEPPLVLGSLFTAGASVAVGPDGQSIKLADLNHDGKLDAVVIDRINGTMSTLLGNGDGTFAALTQIATGNSLSMAIADVNGDDKPDVVVVPLDGGGMLEVYAGNGDGTFKAPAVATAGASALFVAAGDVNGDGKQDLIVSNNGSDTVSVLLGTGNGSFQAPVTFTVGAGINGDANWEVKLADFNGDGKLDIAVANPGSSSSISVLLGNGLGGFGAYNSYAAVNARYLTTGDFNGDGRADIAASNADNSISVFLSNPNGTLRSPTIVPAGAAAMQIAAADVSGDGKLDLVYTNGSFDGLSSVLGNGDGTFQAPTSYATGANKYVDALALGDLNGDGAPDALVTTYDPSLSAGALSAFMHVADPLAPTLAITSPGGRTSQTSPTITGTIDLANAELTVSIYDGATLVGTATPTADGRWSTIATISGDGVHYLVAKATTPSGHLGASAQNVLTLDTTPPALAITSVAGLTNHPAQMITGTIDVADTSQTVSIYDGATLLGTATPAANGVWSTSVTLSGQGLHNLVAKATDSVGNAGASSPGAFTLDTIAPALTITSAGGLTNKPVHTIAGTIDFSEAGATVTIYDGATALATTTSAADGSWSTSVTLVGDGPHALVAKATDAAGNTGASASLDFMLDTQAPAAPGIALTTDTGVSRTDKITSNAALSLSGVEAGATAEFSADGGKTWTSAFFGSEGPNSVMARQNDAAGNLSAPSAALAFTLDTSVPTLTITSPGGLTSNAVQTISGTIDEADAGAIVYVYESATLLTTATPTATGTWSVDVTLTGDGPHALVAKATDVAGNAATSAPESLTLDTQTPTLVGISRVGAASQLAGATLQFTVAFSEVVTGVDASAFRLKGTDTGATIASITGTGSTYTVNVNPGPGVGTVELDIVGDKIRDAAGNPFASDFAAFTNLPVGPHPLVVKLADVNGDGKLDIVTADQFGASMSVLLGQGDGNFAPATSVAVGAGPGAFALKDVNGDGKLDLVVANTLMLDNVNLVGDTISVALGKGDGTFMAPTSYLVGIDPSDVVLADVNGDGKLDAVVADALEAKLSVLLGNGNGTFQAQTTLAAGDTPVSLAVVDVDGDGKADILATNVNDNSISMLLGAGDGTFQPQTKITAGQEPEQLLAIDVNGDGKLDLITANGADGTVSVLLGNGDGTFKPHVDYGAPAGAFVNSIAMADVNGDGKLDIAATAYTGANSVAVLLGNGDGTFSGPTQTSVGSQGVLQSLALADVNGDGRPDIVAANGSISGSVDVLLNAPALQVGPQFTLFAGPTLAAPVLAPASDSGLAGDNVTNKAAPSFTVGFSFGVVAGDTMDLLVNGASLAHPVTHLVTDADVAAGSVSLSIAAGDLGADGAKQVTTRLSAVGGQSWSGPALGLTLDTMPPTITITNSSGRVGNATQTIFGTITPADAGRTISLYDGATLLATTTASASGAWSADVWLSADSLHNIQAKATDAAGNPGASAIVALTLDTLAPTASITLVGGSNQAQHAALQFAVTFSETVTGVDASAFSLSGTDTTATIGSVAGSGASYIVNVNSGANVGTVELDMAGPKVRDLAGNAFGSIFGAPVSFGAGTSPSFVTLSDLNGDGKLDVVVANSGDSTVSVLLGNGAGLLDAQTIYNVGSSPDSIAIGDLNGDGKKDIVVANAMSNSVNILLGAGNGTFTAKPTRIVGADPSSIALADINGDGKLDIVTANALDNDASIFLGAGDGTFGAQTTVAAGPTPVAGKLADVNSDGKVDLVVANTNDGTLSILRGVGNGTFSAPTTVKVGPSPDSLVLADVNGDGKLDVVVGNDDATAGVSVLIGNGDGTFKPAVDYRAGDGALSVALADVNGDGKLDIVASASTTTILYGNGDGSFSGTATAGTGPYPYGVAVGDMNGDGRADLVTANEQISGSVSIALNAPSMQSGPAFMIVGPPTVAKPVLASGSDSGVAGDGTTNVTAPSFTVWFISSVATGDTIQLLLAGGSLAHPVIHVVTDADVIAGFVTLSVTAGDVGLDGVKQISAVATDGLGQVTPTAALAVTLDTTPPSLAITSGGGQTNKTSQTITGTIDASDVGLTVSIYDNGALLGTATPAANGAWSRAVTIAGETTHDLVVTATDAAGNVGSSAKTTLTLDLTAPALSITSASGPTSQATQTITGTIDAADINLTVSIYDGATLLGTTTALADGTWSKSVTLVGERAHSLVAKATDAAGNVGSSGASVVTLDLTPPALAITSASGPTNQTTQTIAGTIDAADSNLTVSIYDGSTLLGTATPAAGGAWSTSVTLSGGDRTYNLVARATDAAGNAGASAADALKLDTHAPAPVINSAGGLVSSAVQTVAGTLEAADGGLMVSIYDGATLLGTTTSAADGSWSATVTLVSNGAYNLVAKATDAAGNTGVSAPKAYTLDNQPPTLAITTAPGFTNQPTRTIAGTIDVADFGQTVSIYDGATLLGTATPLADGTWSTSVTLSGERAHSLVAKASDPTGNAGSSAPVVLTLDMTPPSLAITSGGGQTNKTSQTITGTIDASDIGLTVSIYDNGALLGTATPAANGAWSRAVTIAGETTHDLVVTATDAAGNVGSSAKTTLTLDLTAPALSITSASGPTSQATQTITGTIDAADINLTVSIYDGATLLGTTTALADGTWSKSVTLVGERAHSLVAKATDAAGNVGSSGASVVTLDLTPPALAITSASGPTNQTTQTIAGTIDAADSNLTVSIYDGSTLLGTATPAAGGAWSTSVTLSGGDRTYNLVARATDAAGNAGASATVVLTLDTSMPSAPGLALEADTGSSSNDDVTSDGKVITSGVLPGATAQYSIDGGKSWTGSFTAVQGANSVMARQINAAGSTSQPSAALSFTLDTLTPVAPQIALAADTGSSQTDKTTSNGALALTGVEPNAKAEYSIDGGKTWTTSFTPAQGGNSVIARQTDLAGNMSQPSAAFSFTLDSVAPALVITSASGPTNKASQTITGYMSDLLDASLTVSIYDGSTLLATTTQGQAGGWTANVTLTGEAAHNIIAKATDLAGNTGASATDMITLDTVAPTATISLVGSAGQATGTPLQFKVTFSEAVTGVDASAFSLSGSDATAHITGLASSGSTYTVNVDPGANTGTVGLNLIGAKIKDLAGNGFAGGSFQAQSTVNFSNTTTALAVGDVNGDGKPDLISADYYGYTQSYTSSYVSDGRTYYYTYYAYYYNYYYGVALGDGNGGFALQGNFSAPTEFRSLKLADVNGDGKLDMLATDYSAELLIALGNGDGSFRPFAAYSIPSWSWSVAVADLNGDRKADIVTTDVYTNSVSVLVGNGNGTFQPQTAYAVGSYPFSVAVDDLNGDGKPDLVVTNEGSNSVSVLLGNGNGTFQPQATYATQVYPLSVAVDDLNGDGKPDLVVANEGSNSVSVLLGNGNGTFQPQATYATQVYPFSVAVADVNGDGKLDLVVANEGSNSVSVLLGNGDGTFQRQASYGATGWPVVVAVADVNGDGRPDIVAGAAGTTPYVSVLLNSSTTQQGPSFTISAPTSPGNGQDGYISGATVFADANGDGVWEAGEATTTTDARGNFQLQNAVGPLILTGGVDTSTNLAFTGRLTAPSGYQVISPITTLVQAMLPSAPSASDIQTAEQNVLSALGVTLGAGQSLSTLDPIAGSKSGDAAAKAALIAGANIVDTVDMLTSALSAAKGSSSDATSAAVLRAIAGQISSNPGAALDLTSVTSMVSIAVGAATIIDPANQTPLTGPFISNVATVVSNSNAALTQAATAASDPTEVVAAHQVIAQGQITTVLSDSSSVNSLPNPPSIALASDSGASPTDGVTSVGALAVTGLATGASAQYSIDGGATWTSSFTAVEGSNTVEVREKDIAENFSPPTSPLVFTLDTHALAPGLALANDTGSSPSDRITASDGFTLTGVESGAVVEYSMDSGATWTKSFAAVEGQNAVEARQTDLAGNVSAASAGLSFNLDTHAPTLAITSSGGLTNKPSQTVTGTIDAADAGLSVSIYDGAALLGTATPAADGTWSTSVTLSGDGAHNLVAKATDAAGNAGASAQVGYSLDTTAPTLAITSSGGLTNQTTQTLSGTISAVDANLTIAFYDGATLLGTTTANAQGVWSKSVTLSGEGAHSLTVKATDEAGNAGASSPLGITLDTVAPMLAITNAGGPISQATQTLSGTIDAADANLPISIYDGATLLGTTTANASGVWSKSVTLSGDGAHGVTAKATDAAGNAGTSAAIYFTLETAAPTLTITSVGGLSDQANQTLTGTIDVADASCVISLYDGATLLGTTAADVSGAWSKTVTLTEGVHSITAEASNGNAGKSAAAVYVVASANPIVVDVAQLATADSILSSNPTPFLIVLEDTIVNISNAASLVNKWVSSEHIASITRTGIVGQAYSSYEDDYNGRAYVGSRYFYTNVSGQPFSAYETDLDLNGHLTRHLFSGVTGQAYSSFEYDYNTAGALSGSKYFFTNVTGQAYTGYELDLDPSNRIAKYAFTGVSGQAYNSYEYDYVAGALTGTKYFFSGVTGQAYTDYEVDFDAANRVSKFAFSGVSGQAYSSYEYDYFAGNLTGTKYFFTNVTGQPFTGYEVDFDASNRVVKYAFTGVIGQRYSAYEYDYDATGLAGSKYFFTNIAGQPYTGREIDLDPTGQVTRYAFTGVSGQGYTAYEYDYANGALVGSKYFFTDISGTNYSGNEQDFNAAGQMVRSVFTGVALQPYSSFEYDYVNGALSGSKYYFENVIGQSYSSYETHLDASGAVAKQILDNNDGSHRIVGFQDNLTFSSIGRDVITGGGADETFVIAPLSGPETITDFWQHMTGAGHDTIQLAASEYTDFATLLTHATDSAAGVQIAGAYGDSLTLTGVTVAQLSSAATSFKFV